ncbi:MAG: hypothetical protein HC836_30615 [Richelia sp. RM2_1_2]|nr:hypothetical protein [Richelia sp. SM2_1_7]NJM20878.1 hypothetical protein [Richelia sp. SM1_7_0]NJN11659.1 hypothetical protein [Richelia sp. RM1_1_1]NJO29917.1 hypothetical protein [Richelia sp. SL_2_1]NJO62423.1 hypothetical protein [Richelia sp. RM2_1_2]
MKPLRYICLAAAAFAVVTLSSCLGDNAPTTETSPTTETVTQTQTNQNGEADVDYMSKMALMKGHLLVAKELLDKNEPKQAEPHIGHPVEEIYGDVEDQLKQRDVKEFKTTLGGLHDLVKSKPKDAKVSTSFVSSMEAVDGAIAAIPEEQRNKPEFVLAVINRVLDTANEEYSAAIANGKIVEDIEYQDSRGFVVYAQDLYNGISSQMKTAHPEEDKAITSSMSELSKAWPSVIPPSASAKTPEEVTTLVKTIEENSQKVIKN